MSDITALIEMETITIVTGIMKIKVQGVFNARYIRIPIHIIESNRIETSYNSSECPIRAFHFFNIFSNLFSI